MNLYPATGVTGTDPDPAELAKFMALVRQHENGGSYAWTEDYASSGHFGAYQIGTPEWAAWSIGAGVNPADHSPAAQDKVAAWQFTRYYRQFGTWRRVAIAWYGGPGKAQRDVQSPGSVDHIGTPPIGEYADFIDRGMAAAGSASPSAPTGADGIDIPGPWDIPIPNVGTNMIPGWDMIVDVSTKLVGLADFATLLLNPHTWLRVVMVVGGAGLVAVGVTVMLGDLQAVQQAVTSAATAQGAI